ncbi:hypothetical protein [Oceanivirga salmonicida]|uniref:hypothetical protein n=1 Tax=Oceanivirga salmonicida TaxID=1769291 RepID=UPI0008372692|nr:hypothetical protein [Oceanivirga salmonicida]
MKKVTKAIFILLLIASCTTMKVNISRQDAYKLNAKYVQEKYNQKVDNKKVGFYLAKNRYELFSLIGDTIYHLTLDKDGNLVSSESYPAY